MSTDSVYWDKKAENEDKHTATSITEQYTQEQCLTTFKRGLKYVQYTKPDILKTDSWTEGVAQNREILSRIEKLCPKATIYPMDISREVCQLAKSNNVIQADIRLLPYRDTIFDMIFDQSTIDHVPIDDAENTLVEYKRCLRDNGVLVVIFAHSEGAFERYRKPDSDYFTFWIEDIKRMLLILGFQIREEYAIHFLNLGALHTALSKVGYNHIPRPLIKVWQRIEFSWISKHIRQIAPLYTIIAQR